jgi:hypothetical protein
MDTKYFTDYFRKLDKGKRLRLITLIVLVILMQLACNGSLPTTAEATSPAPQVDKVVPALTPETSAEPVFFDDFSDPLSGWDRYVGADGEANYHEDGYRLLIHRTDWILWANPGGAFRDVRIEVDTQKLGGDDDNMFGVICRYQDLDNFYALAISSDGYYGILKRQDGSGMQYIQMDSMQSSSAIHVGERENHIGAECAGDTLRLFVNDTLVDEVSDPDFTHGDIGVIAGTFSKPETEILFSNLEVYDPQR